MSRSSALRYNNQGLSLVEIVVASFLLSILLLVGAKVMIPALRAWTDGQKRSELSQGLLVTANWIQDDVVRSSPESLKFENNIFHMRCALGQVADHTNEFNEQIAYWLDGDGLFRGDKTLADPETAPTSLTLADLTSVDSKRRVASGVESLNVEVPQPWRAEIHLVLRRGERTAEVRTSYTSMYAPFDPNVVEEDLARGS